MNQIKRWIQKVGQNRRGSSTMEYIVIIVVGALFAGLLYQAFQADQVQLSLKAVVENTINGKTNNPPTDQDKNDSHSPDIQFSPKNNSFSKLNTKVIPSPSQKKKEEDGVFLSEVTGFVVSLGKDIGYLIDAPIDYLKETVNWDELKQQWSPLKGEFNKFRNDPKGYSSNFYNNATKKLSGGWDKFIQDPKGYASNAWNGYKKNVKNSLKGFWYGEDPETKDKLTIPERVLGLVDIIPISPKKAVKELPEVILEIGCGKGTGIKHEANNDKCEKKSAAESNEKIVTNVNSTNKKIPSEKTISFQSSDELKKQLEKLGYRSDKIERLISGVEPELGLKTGQVIEKNGAHYVIMHNGKQKKLPVPNNYGKNREVTIADKEYNIPIDEAGFPNFDEWATVDTVLDSKYLQVKPEDQFLLLDVAVGQNLNNPTIKNKIEETALETIKTSIGSRKMGTKYERYFKETGLVKKLNMTDQELKDVIEGRGSEELFQRITNNPELKEEFLKTNEEWIKKGEDPLGYTWHHHQQIGRMQLVETKVHAKINHVGGEKIWGGTRDGSNE